MDDIVSAPVVAGVLLVGMLLLMEVGHRLGAVQLRSDPDRDATGVGAVEGAIFALFGLLLAFTLSGAGGRLDTRRHLIVEEANDIGTAYLRLDLLPAEAQPALRQEFRDYLDSRLEVYRKVPDLAAVTLELSKSARLQKAIWSQAVAATRLEGAHPNAAILLLPAINAMIDITSTRTMAARIHSPRIVYMLLAFTALVSSLLAGRAMAGRRKRSWLHILAVVFTTAIAVYVIVELEYPRMGLFRLDAYDQVMVDLRQGMK